MPKPLGYLPPLNPAGAIAPAGSLPIVAQPPPQMPAPQMPPPVVVPAPPAAPTPYAQPAATGHAQADAILAAAHANGVVGWTPPPAPTIAPPPKPVAPPPPPAIDAPPLGDTPPLAGQAAQNRFSAAAQSLVGEYCGPAGCARAVDKIAKLAGVPVPQTENAGEFERQLAKTGSGWVQVPASEADTAQIVTMKGSGGANNPSGRHIEVHIGGGRTVGDPGRSSGYKIRTGALPKNDPSAKFWKFTGDMTGPVQRGHASTLTNEYGEPGAKPSLLMNHYGEPSATAAQQLAAGAHHSQAQPRKVDGTFRKGKPAAAPQMPTPAPAQGNTSFQDWLNNTGEIIKAGASALPEIGADIQRGAGLFKDQVVADVKGLPGVISKQFQEDPLPYVPKDAADRNYAETVNKFYPGHFTGGMKSQQDQVTAVKQGVSRVANAPGGVIDKAFGPDSLPAQLTENMAKHPVGTTAAIVGTFAGASGALEAGAGIAAESGNVALSAALKSEAASARFFADPLNVSGVISKVVSKVATKTVQGVESASIKAQPGDFVQSAKDPQGTYGRVVSVTGKGPTKSYIVETPSGTKKISWHDITRHAPAAEMDELVAKNPGLERLFGMKNDKGGYKFKPTPSEPSAKPAPRLLTGSTEAPPPAAAPPPAPVAPAPPPEPAPVNTPPAPIVEAAAEPPAPAAPPAPPAEAAPAPASAPAETTQGVSEATPLHIRTRAVLDPSTDAQAIGKLAHDTDTDIRLYAAEHPNADNAALATLARDTDPNVRAVVARNPNTPGDVLSAMAKEDHSLYGDVRGVVANHKNTPKSVLHDLASDPNAGVRMAVAANPNTDRSDLLKLTKDPDEDVQSYAQTKLGIPKTADLTGGSSSSKPQEEAAPAPPPSSAPAAPAAPTRLAQGLAPLKLSSAKNAPTLQVPPSGPFEPTSSKVYTTTGKVRGGSKHTQAYVLVGKPGKTPTDGVEPTHIVIAANVSPNGEAPAAKSPVWSVYPVDPSAKSVLYNTRSGMGEPVATGLDRKAAITLAKSLSGKSPHGFTPVAPPAPAASSAPPAVTPEAQAAAQAYREKQATQQNAPAGEFQMRSNDGKEVSTVQGKPVKIEAAPNYSFFMRKDGANNIIHETSTGMQAGSGKTQTLAIKDANDRINLSNQGRGFENIVKKQLENRIPLNKPTPDTETLEQMQDRHNDEEIHALKNNVHIDEYIKIVTKNQNERDNYSSIKPSNNSVGNTPVQEASAPTLPPHTRTLPGAAPADIMPPKATVANVENDGAPKAGAPVAAKPLPKGEDIPTASEEAKATAKQFVTEEDGYAKIPIIVTPETVAAASRKISDFITEAKNFGSNLNMTKKYGSRKLTAKVYRLASFKARAAVLMHGPYTQIVKLMPRNTNAGELFNMVMIESQLRGIRERWQGLSSDAANAPDAALVDTKTLPDGSTMTRLAGTWKVPIEALSGTRKQYRGLDDEANRLAMDGDVDGVRDLLEKAFSDAADTTGTMPLKPGEFDSTIQDTAFQKALEIWKRDFASELATTHATNEGIFRTNFGPADSYFPLIRADENGEPIFAPTSGGEFGQPKNTQNNFATGQSENYDYSVKGLSNNVRGALKRNAQADMMRQLEAEDLLQPTGNIKVEKAKTSHEMDKRTIEIRGHEYPAVVVSTSKPRMVVSDQGMISIGAKQMAAPSWLVREMGPLLHTSLPEWGGTPIGMPEPFRQFINAVNNSALIAGPEAIYHTKNLLSTAISEVIPEGLTGKILGGTPMSKASVTVAQIANTNPMSDENLANLREMAEAGVIPDRYGNETRDKLISEVTGAHLNRWSLAPELFGRTGVDIRSRLYAWRQAKASFGLDPDAPLARDADGEFADPKMMMEMAERVSHFGVYNRALEGSLQRFLKDTGMGPWATAATTMTKNGMRLWLNTLNFKDIPGGSTGKRVAASTYLKISAGIPGLVAFWAIWHHQLTGKWPWEDRNSRLLEIPISRQAQTSEWGKKVLPQHGRVYINVAGIFNPLAGRGASAWGIQGAYDTYQRTHYAPAAQEAAMRGPINAGMHIGLGGPFAAGAFRAVTGDEPYMTSLTQGKGRRQRVGGQFMTVSHDYAPHGAKPQLQERAEAALGNLNSFVHMYAEGDDNPALKDSNKVAGAIFQLSGTLKTEKPAGGRLRGGMGVGSMKTKL